MDVLIVTSHNRRSLGFYMQAHAMYKILKKMGRTPVFLRLPPSWDDIKYQYGYYISYKPAQMTFNMRLDLAYRQYLNNMPLTKSQNRSMQYPVAIICGNEILDINSRHLYKAPQFFGDNINASRIVGYALCCGDSQYDDMVKYSDRMRGLQNMSMLSADNDHTNQVLTRICGYSIPTVLNPTLLIEELYEYNIAGDSNFILVYGFRFSKNQIKEIKEFARRTKRILISLDVYNKWCDYSIPTTPHRALGLIHSADYIVTDTFYGVIFSIIFRKQFVSFATQKKIANLLSDLGLAERDRCHMSAMEDVLLEEVNWDAVATKIVERRRHSLNFLQRALNIDTPRAIDEELSQTRGFAGLKNLPPIHKTRPQTTPAETAARIAASR